MGNETTPYIGFTDETLGKQREVQPGFMVRCRKCKGEHPLLLTPRWPNNAAFWSALVQFAADADSRLVRTTQLLGCCLTAADLEHPTECVRRRHLTSLAAPRPPELAAAAP